MRFAVRLVGVATAAGFAWILTLPDKAECSASGRVVDPTERHCLAADGFQQLQEHALFHASQVMLGAAILMVVAYVTFRYRRSMQSAPAA